MRIFIYFCLTIVASTLVAQTDTVKVRISEQVDTQGDLNLQMVPKSGQNDYDQKHLLSLLMEGNSGMRLSYGFRIERTAFVPKINYEHKIGKSSFSVLAELGNSDLLNRYHFYRYFRYRQKEEFVTERDVGSLNVQMDVAVRYYFLMKRRTRKHLKGNNFNGFYASAAVSNLFNHIRRTRSEYHQPPNGVERLQRITQDNTVVWDPSRVLFSLGYQRRFWGRVYGDISFGQIVNLRGHYFDDTNMNIKLRLGVALWQK